MRFSGKTNLQQAQENAKWHIVFAWFPVQLETGEWVWLERVWRRDRQRAIRGYDWIYKPLTFMPDNEG